MERGHATALKRVVKRKEMSAGGKVKCVIIKRGCWYMMCRPPKNKGEGV